MNAPHKYVPLPQEQEETAQAQTQIHLRTTRKAQIVNFITKNGVLLVICGDIFFASINLCVKLLGKMDPPIPTLEVVAIRMAITTCCTMPYMVANGIPDPFLGPKGVRGLLVIRVVGGFAGLLSFYYALNYLPLADATVLAQLYPFVIGLAAYRLLGEIYTMTEALAAVFSLFGVILIARPPFLFGSIVKEDGVTTFERLRAIGALVSACSVSGSLMAIRAIGSRAQPVQILNFFALWSFIGGTVAMVLIGELFVFPTTWERIMLLLIIGLFSVIGQYLLTFGLRYDTAVRCSLASYTQLFFAAVLEFVVFGTVPSAMSAAGAAIIVVSQASALLLKQNKPPQPSPAVGPLHPDDFREGTLPS